MSGEKDERLDEDGSPDSCRQLDGVKGQLGGKGLGMREVVLLTIQIPTWAITAVPCLSVSMAKNMWRGELHRWMEYYQSRS